LGGVDREDVAQRPDNVQAAEVCLPTADLTGDLAYFTDTLGFRLDTIFPADDPSVATFSGHGLRIRLERGAAGGPGVLRVLCKNVHAFAGGERTLTAPGGTRILIVDADPPLEIPPTAHAFVVRRLADHAPWIIGRAGMRYRDLIPGRLGGSIIASHIRIPEAGPVPDMVHYHTVGFQLIFCYTGWVRLVYEDQGPPFVLNAGDCVIQPPRIRHRVLESSDNLQVIEVGVPAEHVTTVDHVMELPTPVLKPDRDFSGQKFCRSQAAHARWRPWRLRGFDAWDTGISEATAGVASVHVIRAAGLSDGLASRHTSDIQFTFVLAGSLTLRAEGQDPRALVAGDAYVIPPALDATLTDCSADLRLLEVSLPAVPSSALTS
jgi:quercetin dioxygenase-like cupin family protein/catechol 2,3-dioxygenase-like lactoylglutathione lyase family enzyme